MNDPENLTIEWIGKMLRQHRLQQKDLARALHIAPSGVTRLLAGNRKLRPREADVVRQFFGQHIRDVPYEYDPGPARSATVRKPIARPGTSELVPVYASLAAHRAREEPAEWREPPAPLRAARDVYGFFVDDEGFAPLLVPGDIAYVHPARPARDHSRVLVQGKLGVLEPGLLLRGPEGRDLVAGGVTRRLDSQERYVVIAAIEAS